MTDQPTGDQPPTDPTADAAATGEERPTPDQGPTDHAQAAGERGPLTIEEAAAALGVTPNAVRQRIKRGTLAGERGEGGWSVWLPPADRPTGDRPDRPHGPQPTGDRPPTDRSTDHGRGELVAQLRSEVERMGRLLDEANEARRRADHLMAGMIEDRRALAARVAELEAGATSETGNGEAPVAAPDVPHEAEPAGAARRDSRPWWRRLMGG